MSAPEVHLFSLRSHLSDTTLSLSAWPEHPGMVLLQISGGPDPARTVIVPLEAFKTAVETLHKIRGIVSASAIRTPPDTRTFWGDNQTVEAQLVAVARMTERECCYLLSVARGFTDSRVVVAARLRAARLARERLAAVNRIGLE